MSPRPFKKVFPHAFLGLGGKVRFALRINNTKV